MDSNQFEDIRNLITTISEAIIILAPVGLVAYHKILKVWNRKRSEIMNADRESAKQELLSYSHAESMKSMENLREICNLFFDRTHADRVMYFQLENGTMGDSKLQNMFISCMAESDRYSLLPSRVNQVQRCPVQSVVSHIEQVNRAAFIEYVEGNPNYSNHLDPRVKEILYAGDSSAIRIKTVHNAAGYIIGYIVFEYLFDKLGIQGFTADETPNSLICECVASVEAELIRYQKLIAEKKSQLGLI